jgi:hypothetical protein
METEYRLPLKHIKDNQIFEISDFNPHHISYGELKSKGLRQIMKEVEMKYKEYNYTINDYTNLRWQLIEFMTDVDEHFKWKNFLYYEWYLPIRNKIIKTLK